MSLKNKKILLIVGGGISAYKALDLIRLLRKKSVEIKVILTKSGKEFVTPLSITSLTNNKTFEDIFDSKSESEIDHIALSRWADLIIVLPTTANFMAKLSVGKAEDLATTVLLASNKDIILVPAMNVRMWLHKATQNNFKILQDWLFIHCLKRKLFGRNGDGKMLKVNEHMLCFSKNLIKNKSKALITTGPTKEYIILLDIFQMTQESKGFGSALAK